MADEPAHAPHGLSPFRPTGTRNAGHMENRRAPGGTRR